MMQRRIRAIVLLILLIVMIVVIVNVVRGCSRPDPTAKAVFAPTAAPTPVPTAEPTPVPDGAQGSAYRVVVESGNGLNLRAHPDQSGDVLYVLPYGMVLTVLGEAENGFLHVTWAGYEGYVSGAYVAPFGAQGGE